MIVLEDQFDGLGESKVKELIKFLCEKYQKEYYNNERKRSQKIEKNKIQKQNEEKEEINDPFPFGKKEYKTDPFPFGKKERKIIKFPLEQKDDQNSEINKEIDITQEMVDLILEKCNLLQEIKNLNNSWEDLSSINESDENSKKYLTMSSINKFCRTFIFFKNKLSQTNIKLNSINDFSFDLLFEKKLLDKNEEKNNYKEIQEYLGRELLDNEEKFQDDEEQYFFNNSESLVNFMVQIYACSLVNQHLCIVGPPGIGKTVGASKFSLIRQKILESSYKTPFCMHTFHQFTRPSDYFGISSLKDEKLDFREGTLTKSIKQGNIFIGDEFNISSEDCMKAITPVLELKFDNDILIPGIEGNIKIDPDFFFIICQNDKSTFGRKDLPEKIKIKVKVINYPEKIKSEIEAICLSMYSSLLNGSNEENIKKILSEEQAKSCGDFMMRLNNEELLTPWSLRDISKLFARIKKQSKNPDYYYENLGLYEHILFYILSSTNESLIHERKGIVVKLIQESFNIEINENQYLKELYYSPPHLTIKKIGNEQKIYIEKGKTSIFFCNEDKKIYEIYSQLNNLPSILNALFKILISSEDEPILISGPNSFKTFLAQLVFHNKDCDVISLNSELTISQLIGSPTLLTTEKAKYFYLKQIYEISKANNIDNLLKDLEDLEANKEKIKNNINSINIGEESPFYYALHNFKKKL